MSDTTPAAAPAIIDNQSTPEWFFEEGCHITEWLNDPQDPALSMARARVEPGRRTRWHRLEGTFERYLMLDGQGEVWVGDLPPQRVRPGDVVLIPAGVRQRIVNDGTTDLVFVALCTPRFTQACYTDLE